MCLLSTRMMYMFRENIYLCVVLLGNGFEQNGCTMGIKMYGRKVLRFKSKWYSILTRIHIQSSNIKSNKNLNFEGNKKIV